VIISVLGNDSDVEGDALSVTIIGDPANGSVIVNPDGTITYTPNADSNGGDAFIYQISDGNGGMDTATVNVTVNPVNDAPTAVDDSATTAIGTPVTINVLANDTDIDSPVLTVAGIVSGPANGSASVNANGSITYTPNTGFAGNDSFEYQISDGNGGTDTATVFIAIESPSPQTVLDSLVSIVNQLKNDGVLKNNEANKLLSKLKLNGNQNTVLKRLQAFIDETEQYVQDGTMTAAQAQPLLDGGQLLIQLISTGSANQQALAEDQIFTDWTTLAEDLEAAAKKGKM
jgi:hypothetical protein